jgi:hypothetical protein
VQALVFDKAAHTDESKRGDLGRPTYDGDTAAIAGLW